MSKCVLVMDMPSSCMGCNFLHCEIEENKEYCEAREIRKQVDLAKEEKPDWCPLREFPQRANHPDWCDGGRYDKGYNACIDELLKGEEG